MTLSNASLAISVLVMGTVVSVGALAAPATSSSRTAQRIERIEILDEDRTFNVRVSPLGFLVGAYRLDVNRRLGEGGWTGGMMVERSQLEGATSSVTSTTTSINWWGVGARTSYFLEESPFVDSIYLTTGLEYLWGSAQVQGGRTRASGDLQIAAIVAMIGYQWHWENFNLALGLGGRAYRLDVRNATGSNLSGADFDLETSGGSASISGIGPTGELAMGWSF